MMEDWSAWWKIGKRNFPPWDTFERSSRASCDCEKCRRVFSFRCWSDSQCRRAREHFKLARNLGEKSCKLLEDINSLQNSLSSFIPTFFFSISISHRHCWRLLLVLHSQHYACVHCNQEKKSRIYFQRNNKTEKNDALRPTPEFKCPPMTPPLCSLLWYIPNSVFEQTSSFLRFFLELHNKIFLTFFCLS